LILEDQAVPYNTELPSLETLTFDQQLLIAGPSVLTGIALPADGTSLVLGSDTWKIYNTALDGAFDLTNEGSTSTYLPTDLARSRSVRWNDDGTKFYTVDFQNLRVYQWALDPAYDIADVNAASVETSLVVPAALGMDFAKDGEHLYLSGTSSTITRYTLSTPYDVSSATQDYSEAMPGGSRFDDILMGHDGTRMWCLPNTGGIAKQFTLSTPYDTRTGSWDGASTNLTFEIGGTSPSGMYIPPARNELYVSFAANERVQRYTWT
jgi:hypothetical protein